MIQAAERFVALTTTGLTQLRVNDVPVQFSSRKALAILLYLSLQSNLSESRERLATILWSDSGPEQARGALRQALRRMKQDLGPAEGLVEADRTLVRLTCPVRCDILDAIEAAGRGTSPEMLARDDGGLARLFADLQDLDADFDLWIAVQKERLTSQLVSKLEGAIAAAQDPALKLTLAEALQRADPTHEGACRAAMETHLTLGDSVQAMRLYERLWKVLDEELDVEPSEKTQALYVAIKQGQAAPALGGAPSPAQDLLAPIAIVVEPLMTEHLSGDFGYFGTIFRDEMIAALSRFRDWLVVDGGEDSPTPPAYRAYSLRILFHPIRDSVSVSLRMTDRADNHCVWAERYTVTLDGIAELHRTALRQLAVALNVHLSVPRLRSAQETQTPMGRKYETWIQAQAILMDWRPSTTGRAEQMLRDLIDSTPTFAPAMVALAQSLNSRPVIFPGQIRHPEMVRESLDLTARAVKLDPLDSRTHLARAWSHIMSGAHTPALSHLDMAMDLNENDPWTIISAGLLYTFADQTQRAEDLIRQAETFGMRHSRAAQGYIATARYLLGDYPAALAASEVAGDAIPNLLGWQAASRIKVSDPEGAAEAIGQFFGYCTSAWAESRPPSEADIIAWFANCFPIKSAAKKADLRDALTAAAEHRSRRSGA